MERILWATLGICGMIWIIYFIKHNIEDENPLVGRMVNIDLSQVDYPAITICSEQTTMYAFAERLGNYIDPKKALPSTLKQLQKNIITRAMTKYSEQYYVWCKKHSSGHTEMCEVKEIHFAVNECICWYIHTT